MNNRFELAVFDSPEMIVYYPREFPIGDQTANIAFGSKVTQTTFDRQPNGRNIISISSSVAKKILLPDHITSLCLFQDDETLYIGPLVGIFSSGFTPFQIEPIGERSKTFSKQLTVQSSVGAVPFLFGEKHINWDHGTIEGYVYNTQGWEKKTMPFPNVVYDRLPNRQSERNPIVKTVKQKLENDYLIPWYNPGFFNKLELYEKMYNDPRAEKYLPETHPFTSLSVVERMLGDYGHVYLKNSNGSHGNGIRHVLYDRYENVYYCRFYRDKKYLLKFNTLENLIDHLYKGNQLENVIVQQGIHLIRKEKKQLDFRIHVNKDEKGIWNVSALAAKVAGTGNPTTHGGSIHTIEEVFPDDSIREKHEKQLKKAALDLAEAIEHNIGGIVGEIGFDLGIDRHGKVWMFEANSKPGRFIFTHPGLKDSDFLTRKLALAFAVHLTEKTIFSPDQM